VIDDVVLSAFGSAGQRCSALRILFLPHETADGLIEGIAGAMDALMLGDPGDPASDIGPLIDDEARAMFANEARADLVVSLHVDSHPNPIASGVATYYFGTDRYGQSSATGERFASLLLREIVARTDLLDCGSHGKTWDLLRRTRMPAVRLDLGYLTNPGDAARLSDPSFRDVVAESIVIAVQRLYLPADDDAPTGALRIGELFAGKAT